MDAMTQDRSDLVRLRQLVDRMPVAMWTTVEEDGSLASRPMSPLEMDEHGALWFFTDRRATRPQHLRAVNLSFTDPERGTYVSLSGRGQVHTNRDRIGRLWTVFARPWFPDGPASPHVVLLEFQPSTVEFWEAPQSRMALLIGLAAPAPAVAPHPLVRHEVVSATA